MYSWRRIHPFESAPSMACSKHRPGAASLPISVGAEVQPGGTVSLTVSLPSGSLGPPLQGEPGQMGSVFDKEPLHPCFNALLLYFKSSTVFCKCWNWQPWQPLATTEQSSIQIKQPQPRFSGKLGWNTQREASLPSTAQRVRVMSGTPKIPEGRIQQGSYTASIIPVSQGRFTNWGKKKFTLVGFFPRCHQGLSRRPESLFLPLRPLQTHQIL